MSRSVSFLASKQVARLFERFDQAAGVLVKNAPKPSSLGTRGGMAVTRSLGAGGDSEVLAVWDEMLHREVAMKIWSRRDGHATEAFVREVRLLSRLEGPGMSVVHSVGLLEDGRPYYTMPRICGLSLDELMESQPDLERQQQEIWLKLDPAGQGQPTMSGRLRLFHAILDVVERAHQCGVIHRDLKPQNLMVRSDGTVVLIDWGSGWELDAEESKFGPLLASRGSPAWMPPESFARRIVTPAVETDIYALGALLFYVCLSEVAFRGPVALISQEKLTGTNIAKRLSGSDVPSAVQNVIGKSMSQMRSDRFGSVAELRRELDTWVVPASLWAAPAQIKGGIAVGLLASALVVGWLLGAL